MKKINFKWVVISLIVIVFLPSVYLIYRIYDFIHKLSEQLSSSMIWPVFFAATFVISIFLIAYLISLVLIIKNKAAGYLVAGITAAFMSVLLIGGVLMYSSSIFSNASITVGIIINFVLLITICITSFCTYVKMPKQVSSFSKKQKILNVFYFVIVIAMILFFVFLTIQGSFRASIQGVNKENMSVTSPSDDNLSKEDYIKQLVLIAKKVTKFPVTIVDNPGEKITWVDFSAEPSAVRIDYNIEGTDITKALKGFMDYFRMTTCENQGIILDKGISIDIVVFDIKTQQKYNLYLTKEDCLVK